MELAWDQIYADVEDVLAPQLELDPWERTLYHHLLRHTRLRGLASAVFAIGPLAKALPISDFKVREVLRSLHAKGCIRIEDRSRNGHLVSVLLPGEVEGLSRLAAVPAVIDIASLDFFSGRQYVSPLLARENHACFYCLRALTAETCELDHLVPQAEKLDNSFRNVVASCHSCNKAKGSGSASGLLRSHFRAGLLSEQELRNRLSTLEAVQSGVLVPLLP